MPNDEASGAGDVVGEAHFAAGDDLGAIEHQRSVVEDGAGTEQRSASCAGCAGENDRPAGADRGAAGEGVVPTVVQGERAGAGLAQRARTGNAAGAGDGVILRGVGHGDPTGRDVRRQCHGQRARRRVVKAHRITFDVVGGSVRGKRHPVLR